VRVFDRVRRGQPFRVAADAWNAILSVAESHHDRSQGFTTTPRRDLSQDDFWVEVQESPYGYYGYESEQPRIYLAKRWSPKRVGEASGHNYGDEFEVQSELNYTAGQIVRVAQIGTEDDGTPIYRCLNEGGERFAILTQDPDGDSLFGQLATCDGSDLVIENPASDEIEFLVPFIRHATTLTPGDDQWVEPELYSGDPIRVQYHAASERWICLTEFQLAQAACDEVSS